MEKQLVERLANAADEARLREDNDLADLLDEAEGELEIAIDLLDVAATPDARRFVARHSEPLLTERAVHDLIWQQRLDYLLAAARLMKGRDTATCAEVHAALGLNDTQEARSDADRAMRAGGFTRRGGVYARLHNASMSGPQRPAQEVEDGT